MNYKIMILFLVIMGLVLVSGCGEESVSTDTGVLINVSITTDKIEYKQGEGVQVIIQNNYNATLQLTTFGGCSQGLLTISEYRNNKWKIHPGSCGSCKIAGFVQSISPFSRYVKTWDQTVYRNDYESRCDKIKVEPGKYKIKVMASIDDEQRGWIESNEFEII